MRTTVIRNKLELQNANNETHLITHWQLHPVNCVGADVLCSEVCHPAVMQNNSTQKTQSCEQTIHLQRFAYGSGLASVTQQCACGSITQQGVTLAEWKCISECMITVSVQPCATEL